MEKMKVRVQAVLLAAIMVFAGIFCISLFNKEAKAAEQNTVIFHYQRTDGNYDDWDVYHWGPTSGAVQFTAEDSFGKIAFLQFEGEITTDLGFIVRNGGDDWKGKDPDGDRFIKVSDFKDGVAEVWLYTGQEEFDTTCPEGYEPFTGTIEQPTTEPPTTIVIDGDAITVNLHYYRYAGDYTDWNIWYWPEGGAYDKGFEFNGEDEYGKVATHQFPADVAKLGFIVRRGNWNEKDCDGDRYIDMSKAVDGVLDIWLLQNDETIYYDRSQVDTTPKILGAAFSSTDRILVKLTEKIKTDDPENVKLFTVKDSTGKEYKISKLFATSTSTETNNFLIILEDKIDMSKGYTLSSTKYSDVSVSFGSVFSTDAFEEAFTYEGNDLGANWTKDSTTFKVWSPVATEVVLNLYKNGTDGDAYQTVPMTKGDKGVWEVKVDGDLNKVYYTYTVTNDGKAKETVDVYARTTGVNGKRGMVIDLDSTDPSGWADDKRPFSGKNPTDAAVYELHVRDFTIDESSGVTNKGKYLGLTEKGTKNATGQSTGLDYIKSLGITHVQILPMYDYSPNSVDETKLDTPQFNWGYDPYNYNAPEGSYSTDPYNGEVRVNEMKQMIHALHNEGISVIMDVVYNHTAESSNSWLNLTVPEYYYRLTEDGAFSNGSGCGNELASERAMVSKYIVDSVVYWASEYHIDGFRFDLMGLIDIETMNKVKEELAKIDPSIIVYGEGWTGGGSTLSESYRAMKKSTYRMNGVGAFSDDIRDGIKGSVFDAKDKGFATGKAGQEERIKSGIIGATDNKNIDWSKVGTDISAPWTASPCQVVNYVSCHDNMTLWDIINSSCADDTTEDKIKMNKLAASIVYTAQGIPFMLSGEEILRTKPAEGGGFDHNSYKSPDSTNSIKWDTLNDAATQDVMKYYQGLIAFRKAHSSLRMTTTEDVSNNLKFLEVANENVVAFVIENKPNGEVSDSVLVIYNANKEAVKVTIPEGEWKVCIKNGVAGTEAIETINGTEVTVDAISCLAMVKGELVPAVTDDATSESGLPGWTIPAIIAAAVVAVIGVVAVLKGKKK